MLKRYQNDPETLEYELHLKAKDLLSADINTAQEDWKVLLANK